MSLESSASRKVDGSIPLVSVFIFNYIKLVKGIVYSYVEYISRDINYIEDYNGNNAEKR